MLMASDPGLLSFKLGEACEWQKWSNEIPFIEWPTGWKVKAIPPFTGAIIRYWILIGEQLISVYLDCYEILGHYGEPYWEVYPYHGDVGRCSMADTKKLLEMIADRSGDRSGGVGDGAAEY